MRLLLCAALFLGLSVAQRFGGHHSPFNSFRGARFNFGRPAPQRFQPHRPQHHSSFGQRPSFSTFNTGHPSSSSFGGRPSSSFGGRPSSSFGGRPSFSTFNTGRPSPSTFGGRPSSSFGGRPSFSSGALHEVQAPHIGSRPSSGFSEAPRGAPSSGGGKGNHVWNGKNYLLTWRSAPGQKFSHSGARSYCARQGMRIVSLDSHEKSAHFIGELGRDNGEYFWAGGVISGDGRTLQWENGRSEPITRGDDRSGGFWSSGGRSGPQPETGGECLAILNNVYNDGIKWHDVACSHTKPTICEE